MIYFIAIVIVYVLHVLLKLNWYMTLFLVIYALLMVPGHKRRFMKAKCNQQKFYDVSNYLDTLLYAFVKEEKIAMAILDVSQTLPQGKMKNLVAEAFEFMQKTSREITVLSGALQLIENEYGCKRVHDVHQFMLHVEDYGGEIKKPINLLLADKNRWERRIKESIAQRKKLFVDVILSVVAALLICSAIVHLPVMDIDINNNWTVQMVAVVVVILNDVIVYAAQKYLMEDWLMIQLTENEAYYAKKMKELHNYNEKREKMLSVISGCVCMMITTCIFFLGNEWQVIAGLLLSLFCFNQHRVGKHLMKKRLVREIKYAFPNWLLDLVLLLQSENVHMALIKSGKHAPGVLKEELLQLTEGLQLQPESSEPFHMFLKEFAIPEVHSAMGILYSLSIGNSGNADKQMSELVEKNLALLDDTERVLLKDSSSGMYVLFLLPVVVASFKLIVDMLFLMLEFVKVPVI